MQRQFGQVCAELIQAYASYGRAEREDQQSRCAGTACHTHHRGFAKMLSQCTVGPYRLYEGTVLFRLLTAVLKRRECALHARSR